QGLNPAMAPCRMHGLVTPVDQARRSFREGQVVDASKNTTMDTEKGYRNKYDAVPARYVKVNVLKNSDNRVVHLMEVRVYEAGK
ncbi:MAG: hypothetical protein WCK05_15805, partial [Planctomycetota bacterium]